ncbi:hypothetical protein ACJX0J_014578, partial [Zea mays]
KLKKIGFIDEEGFFWNSRGLSDLAKYRYISEAQDISGGILLGVRADAFDVTLIAEGKFYIKFHLRKTMTGLMDHIKEIWANTSLILE